MIGAFVIILDQLTKYLVRANMQPGDRIPVIGYTLLGEHLMGAAPSQP